MLFSFDLVSRPWLPAQRLDGTTDELSLLEVFAQAHDLRRLVGELPTQEFALLRLLLAILHDAVNGPVQLEDWEELWQATDPFAVVPGYLDRHRHRFDLLHPYQPFFQVAGLHTRKNQVASLNRIVADVPNGDPFFAMRRPGVERLGLAEAARWLVHAQAFDPSGIKTGMEGDERTKGGKVYPQGTGWAGQLGGVFPEGMTLRETLLLNLIATNEDVLVIDTKRDLPIWRRDPTGPGAMVDDLSLRRPSGPCDLYTWQSRRALLDTDGEIVTGVVLGYGDPLTPHNRWASEPMTGWRRSPAQEKKHGCPTVFMPRQHDPARTAWRGIAGLLSDHGSNAHGMGTRPAQHISPGVMKWLALLTTKSSALSEDSLIRIRLVGAVYGTQQSVVDEVVDDEIMLPVVLLHRERPLHAAQAVAAVSDAELGASALGHLAADLARAAGAHPGLAAEAAREMGLGALDTPYRRWLRKLGKTPDLAAARSEWRGRTRRILRDLGMQVLNSAPSASAQGRVVEIPGVGNRWVDDSLADLWFRSRLNDVLPALPRPEPAPVAPPAPLPVGSGPTPDSNPTVPATDHRPVNTRPARRIAATSTAPVQTPNPAERATAQCIARLRRRCRQNNAAAVAELAGLRRGAGHTAHTVQGQWGIGGLRDLSDILARENTLVRREHAVEAVHLAVTLWALHQQASSDRDMHTTRRSLGGAVRALVEAKGATRPEAYEPMRRRLVRVGTATSIESVALRLREIVLHLKEAQVPLDYGRLADQLYRWQSPAHRADVRREWGGEFHLAARTRKNSGITEPDTQDAAEGTNSGE